MGTAAALSFIKLWGCNSIRGRAMVWLRQWKVCWTHPSKKQVVQRYKRRKLMWMLFHMSILSCVACGPVGILLCLYWFSLPGALSSFCLCFSFLFFFIFQEDTPVQVCCSYLMTLLKEDWLEASVALEPLPSSLWKEEILPFLSPCYISSPTFSVLAFCFVLFC